MTFLQFCHKQFIVENDRALFKQYLGNKAEQDKTPTEWWELFKQFQLQLLK